MLRRGSVSGSAGNVVSAGLPAKRRPRTASWRLWGAVFAALFLATGAIGWFVVVPRQRDQAVAGWRRRLHEISADRANAVGELLRQRGEDAAVIASFPTTSSLIAGGGTGWSAASTEHVSNVLASFALTHGFEAILVYGADDRLLIGWPHDTPPDADAARLARTSRLRADARAAALVRSGDRARVVLAATRGAGTVVLVSDAAGLLSRIAGTTGDAVERLVVAADGDRIVSLDLHRPTEGPNAMRVGVLALDAAPPELREALVPPADPDASPAAMRDDAVESASLAVSHQVPATDWAVVARIPRDVALAEVDSDTRTQFLLAAAWLLAVGGLGFGVIRAQRAAHDEALLRSAANFAALIDRANDSALVLTTEGTIVRASQRAGEFYRTTADGLVGRTVYDLRPASDRDEIRRLLVRAATSDGAIFDAVHIRADGSRVPVEVSARSIELDGETRILTIIRDATRRRAAEARVAALTRFLRALVAVNDAILATDDPAVLTQRVCERIVERSGISAAWIALVPPAGGDAVPVAAAGIDIARAAELLAAMRKAGDAPESICAAGDAAAATARVSATTLAPFGVQSLSVVPIRIGAAAAGFVQLQSAAAGELEGEVLEVVGEIATDVGLALRSIDERRAHEEERARSEAAIRASAARERHRAVELAAVLDAVPVGVWFADDVTAVRIRGNRYAETLLGFPRGTVLSARDIAAAQPANPLCTLDGRPLTYDEMPMVVAARENRRLDNLELTFRRPDGAVVRIMGNAAPVLDEAGVPRGSVGSFLDVTEVRKSDQRLRVLSRVIEQNTASVVVTDPQGNIEYVNPKFERVTGYTFAEARGLNPRVLRSGETPPEVYAQLWATILAGKEWRGEFHNRRKDGTTYWENAVIMPILDEDGRIGHFVAVKEDITLRKEAEAALESTQRELVQAQKMEAIGRLAGGIAHDFNNMLGVILGYAELSVARVPEGDPLRRNLQEICDAADRAANLTGQLLAFSRRQSVELTVLDLSAVARDVTKMVRRLIGEDVELDLRVEGGGGRVRAGRGQLEQVILNLAVNARDAMPHGGRLVVATRPVDVAASGHGTTGRAPVEGAEPGDELPAGRYMLLSVGDTGTGLSPQVEAHMFEPFFTTKDPGKGTGLGLATLWGVVKQCGGHVRYSTAVGRGTTFRIYLPRVDAEVPTGEVAPAEVRRGKGESVLVVEDDPAVRSLVQRLVAAAGYRVVAVSGIDEALAAVDAPGAHFDVVLSDVVMPKMGGPEIVRTLRRRIPTIRAVFMSGYTERVSAQQGELPQGAAFLQKPFTVAKLEQKIREAMDAKPPVA